MLPLRVTCLLEHGSNLREYPSVSLATCECIFSQLVVYFFSQADGCASLENSLKITEISPAAVVAFALFVFHARLHESPLCRSAGKVQVILRRTSVGGGGGGRSIAQVVTLLPGCPPAGVQTGQRGCDAVRTVAH